jgi:hypothetical protein
MNLTWTRRDEWGYESKTYTANSGTWKFHIGRADGHWVLRGWGSDDAFLYRLARTLAEAKQIAAYHA